MGFFDVLGKISPIGNILSPIAGLAGSLISSSGASAANEANINMAWQQLLQQQEFSREMFDKQMSGQKDLMSVQQGYSKELMQLQQALGQENTEWLFNRFQSPEAMSKWLREAGFNPSVIFGNGSGGFGGASSMEMPSLPSTPSASSPSPLGAAGGYAASVNAMAPFGDSLTKITEAIANISKADLNNAYSNKERQNLQNFLEQNFYSAQKAKTDASLSDWNMYIQQTFGESEASAKIQLMVSQAIESANRGDTELARAKMYDALTDLNNLLKDEKEAMRPFFARKAQAIVEGLEIENNLKQQMKSTMKSQSALNYSLSSYYTAVTNTENALRDGKIEMQSLQNDLFTISKYLQGNELDVSDKIKDAKIFGLCESFHREGIITKQAWETLQQLRVRTDWEGRQQFAQYLGSVVGAASQAMQSTGSTINGWRDTEFRNLNAKERNAIRSEFNRIFENKSSGLYNRSTWDDGVPFPSRVPEGY